MLVLVTVKFLPSEKKKKRHPFVSVFWKQVEIAHLKVQKGTSRNASFLVVSKVRTQLSAGQFLGLRPRGSDAPSQNGCLAREQPRPPGRAVNSSFRPPFPSFSPCFLLEGRKGGTGIWRGGSLSPALDKRMCRVLTPCQCVHCSSAWALLV